MCVLCCTQAITEEVGDAGDGKMKQRELVQLVTPENPQYMYRFAESSTEVDLEAPSICGETYRADHGTLAGRACGQPYVGHSSAGHGHQPCLLCWTDAQGHLFCVTRATSTHPPCMCSDSSATRTG